jgi:hypothetical protein
MVEYAGYPFPMRTIFFTLPLAILTSLTGLAQDSAQLDVEKARAELENNFVRVVRLALPGRKDVLLKPLPSETVVVSLRQAALSLVPTKGSPGKWQATAGSATWMHAGVGYSLENEGDSAAELLVICVRDSPAFFLESVPPSAFDPVDLDPRHFRVTLENEQMRVLLLHLNPRDVTQNAQFLEGPLISVDDAHTLKDWADGTRGEERRIAGAVAWEKDGLYSIQNLDDKPLDSVLLELKRPFCSELSDSFGKAGVQQYAEKVMRMVRQKWYKAMPVEARNKEKGRVVIQWKIQPDGTVREDDIVLTTAFARDPLIGAAFAAVRAAAPFPPLPPSWQDPTAEMRFIFLYNLPEHLPGCN